VQLDKYGRLGPIWVIYNFYQDDDVDFSTKRIHIPVLDPVTMQHLPHIGRLVDGCTTSFTVAKIAESLGELGVGKAFTFNIKDGKECQIVRVKELSTGQGTFLVRQFIKA
jgi:hypothetical protein